MPSRRPAGTAPSPAPPATDYDARLDELAEEKRRRIAELASDEAALRRELAAIGIQVSSVYDFVNGTATPIDAVPVLVRHLHLPHDRRVHEGIVRALSYSHLRPAALAPLRAWFAGERTRIERWIGANALASMATLEELADVEGITEFRDLFHPRARGTP